MTAQASPSLAELAALQGVKPISNADDLVGGWPEDEDLDSFLQSALGKDTCC